MTASDTDSLQPHASGTQRVSEAASSGFLAGVVEGYYGRTWSHEDRRSYASLMPSMGLNAFVYCPKADPWLRRQWQQHWPAEQWGELRGLSAHCAREGVQFGVGLSPFALYQRYGKPERRQLQNKLQRLEELDAPLLAILFDDMPGDVPDLAERQAEILADVKRWQPGTRLLMCPTYYSTDPVLEKHFGARPEGYWQHLGELLDRDIDIFWTGSRVCSECIGSDELVAMADTLGRPLTLWDNYPVNDGALRSKHLYLEPLGGREEGIGEALRGHFCNPMNQPWLSLPALRGLAALHGGAELPPDWESALFGAEVWSKLSRDAKRFVEQGLDGMTAAERDALVAEYTALPGPAAAEVAGWLRGEYTFDPACLTD